MKCPNCNSEMPEGGAFCTSCGHKLDAQPAYAQPAYAQPEYTAPVTKKEFMSKYASKKTKTTSLVAKIVSVVCALLFIVGSFTILNGSITDYPIIKLAVPEEELDMDIDTDELDDLVDELLDEYEDDLSKNDEKLLKAYVDDVKALAKKPSFNNLKKIINSTKDVAKISSLSDDDIEDIEEMLESEEMKMIEGIMGVISVVVWGGAIILALFSILAGFKLAFGWAIPAIIINILPSLMFVGVLHFLAVTVGLIALIVIISKANAEYKSYKNGTFVNTYQYA